jgi:phosphoglycolate phosphatase-like HAD superfamily hydrolase
MRIVFDLDGTLYDSMSSLLKVNNEILKGFGYPKVSREEYIKNMDATNWENMYLKLGVKKEHIKEVVNQFVKEYNLREPPILIENALRLIKKIEEKYGTDSIYFLTNESYPQVLQRFERDGLLRYQARVISSFQGKKNQLYALAKKDSSQLIYIGDLVSDGKECTIARKMGADNIAFLCITHKYAMDKVENVEIFTTQNDNSYQVKNYEEILSKIDKLQE